MINNQGLLLQNLRKLISLVDQLRDVGLSNYFTLPRIAVLGTQSSGKSSLLEQIVGIDFLPRGEGVVTRRPLELRISNKQTESNKTYAEFEERKGKKFDNFEQVKQTIIDVTDEVAGKNKGIVDKPIILNVYGPTCPDLTLIDLPGITKISLKDSDQKEDIEKVTKDMASKYCSDPNTVILCVVPANQDLSTSDALQMARRLDPNGLRTLGVLTKIDIMDQGTSAKKILLNQEIQLKLGYVGVKLRSQQDIHQNKLVQQALVDERVYFATNSIYSQLPADNLGTQSLTKKLTQILYQHIVKIIPTLLKDVNSRIKGLQTKLIDLGPPLPTNQKEQVNYLWEIITKFCRQFTNSISGTYDMQNKSNQEIPSSAKIRMIFQDFFQDFSRSKNFKPLKDYQDDEIKKTIQKHEGNSIPGFLSIDAFLAILMPLLEDLKTPAKQCAEDIYIVLEDVATDILDKQIEKFPQIKQVLQELVIEVLQIQKEQVAKSVEDIISSEIGYIFTADTSFLNQENQNKSDKEKATNALVNQLKQRVEDYFFLVVRNLRDSLPKVIGYMLVKQTQQKMLFKLQDAIQREDIYKEIVVEPLALKEERQKTKQELDTLQNALKIIKKDPELNDYITRLASIVEKEEEKVNKKPEKNPVVEIEEKAQHFNDSIGSQSKDNSNQYSQKWKDQQQSQQQQNQQQQQQQQQPRSQTGKNNNDFFPSNPQTKEEDIKKNPLLKQDTKQTTPNPLMQPFQANQQQQSSAAPGYTPTPPPQKSIQQEVATNINNQVGKGVDQAFQSQKVQDGLKQAGKQAGGAAVDQALPGAPAFIRNAGEKAGENIAGSSQFQNAAKEQVKNNLKVEAEPKDAKPAQKKGLFGFLDK